MNRATTLLLLSAVALCISACFAVGAWLMWRSQPAARSSSGSSGGPASSSSASSGIVAPAAPASAARPRITANCIFSTNFVIPNASGKSSASGPAIANPFKAGADPGIVNVSGVYYMATTLSPFEKSRDLKAWAPAGSMQPNGTFWAPEIFSVAGAWWCIYTDGFNGGCKVLKSQKGVEGPYAYSHTIPAPAPMDPTVFVDADGKCYLVTSSISAPLTVCEISADLKTVGRSAQIVKPLQQPGWMHEPVVEAPQILCRVANGQRTYYAVFSANGCCKPAGQNFYALGYCTAPSMMGPWTIAPNNPILGDGRSGVGFGHCCFYAANSGALGVVYQRETAARELCVSRAWFEGDRLVIEPPQIGVAKPSP